MEKKLANFFKATTLLVGILIFTFGVNLQASAFQEEVPEEGDMICRCHTSSSSCLEGHRISFRPRCDCSGPIFGFCPDDSN